MVRLRNNSDTMTATSTRSSHQSINDEIAKLAYQFFVERGYQHGFDREDWLRAERVVKARRSNWK